ncbi:hypothetical protein CSOJ01_09239 [Colletotrichum sojae]|uniref:AB hydrolase-1 domain-containing protein n=1 Tax=Colletotrichum sojae TaxID=2175907 RepID=A0A8H6J3E3_9PEZI|nr:hypothetical protein CSOJ01_09239 [Colletotrichum sojae]
MEKTPMLPDRPAPATPRLAAGRWLKTAGALALLGAVGFYHFRPELPAWRCHGGSHGHAVKDSPFSRFPLPDDPLKFIPCTNASISPELDDAHPEDTWAALFDPDPSHWSWGNKSESAKHHHSDPYAGRGIYLCGYLDVPLDYTNNSDPRIVRLAVTKYQVAGLSRVGSDPPSGGRSKRTIVIEPGGPGGSGTSYAWQRSEGFTARFSDGAFDVLGWDPRGVNSTRPAVSCFPYDADRDRWALLTGQYLEVSDARRQLEIADAMNDAVFRACLETHGDLARFVSTAFVARDLEEIRKALGEEELTGYLVSYGTGIGQTWANMFPDSVGRVILDGTEYVRDHRLAGGFGWTALDNATDAWRDGFLGECISAGPEHCALAKSRGAEPVTLADLEARMSSLISSLADRPMAGYTPQSGPSLVTYSGIVASVYRALYNAQSWPALAQMLHELESGNATLAAAFLETSAWQYDPTAAPAAPAKKPTSEELGTLVICADAYDDPVPELDWWAALWSNMTARSWVSGDSRFFDVFPCRHFSKYWPRPAEVYRGDLDRELKNPVLLIAETYDPATPLRNGRRLLAEMGPNARLVVHHGYGHSSRDTSRCTDAIAKRVILEGVLPEEAEVDCYADEKPYLYGVEDRSVGIASSGTWDPIAAWRQHLRDT